MDAADLLSFVLPPHSASTPRQTATNIPSVFKAGSSDSPNILSPRSEEDFFLASTAGADHISDDLPSVVPSAHLTAAIPLFSPSERSHQQQFNSPASAMDVNMAFAGANPVEFSLPTPPLSEPERLRLPSFNSLGIAAPHPDDIFRTNHRIPLEPVRELVRPWQFPSEMETNFTSETLGREDNNHTAKPGEVRPSLRRNQQVLTPPDEVSDFHFASNVIQGMSTRIEGEQAPGIPEQSSGVNTDASGSTSTTTTAVKEDKDEQFAWLEAVIPTIISSLNLPTLVGQSPRLLSHALPSPSISGHAFSRLINIIRSSPSTTNAFTWINLLHAVPGRFNLADLPTSPPATPGLPLGAGDDYFTTKVFESAITAVDYDEGITATHLRAQQLLAAPSTIHLSIVERYIPPTSPNEFANLFNFRTPSLLVDRMVELSPGNGCLVFIYPTRKGAQTFMQDYVNPILDPLLRQVVIVNNFSADFSTTLGRMNAVERLDNFDTMRRKTNALCIELNESSPNVRQKLHGTPGTYSLVYAKKHEVKLERKVWTDWWIKQEKPRVRAAVGTYYRMANRLPADADTMPYTVIHEILDGITSRRYPEIEVESTPNVESGSGMEIEPGGGMQPDMNYETERSAEIEAKKPKMLERTPESKIEVGVFVVRRG